MLKVKDQLTSHIDDLRERKREKEFKKFKGIFLGIDNPDPIILPDDEIDD